MAGTNNYKLLLQAEIDAKSLQASIEAKTKNSILLIKAQLDPASAKGFESELEKIKSKAKSIGKISFFQDEKGNTNKAIVDYTDKTNNAVKATILLGKEIQVTETITKNFAKDAKEMERAFQNAEKFLAKAQSMDKTNPKVSGAVSTAQDLKSAVVAGNADEVNRLNKQLEVQKSSLSTVKTGWQSLTESMKSNFRTMAESVISFGLIYGALNQIKEAVEYVKDLNKELVNIQLVTGDSAENTAKLAVSYNNLAKEMGATTLEVARGSLEFIRQGKSAEDTAILIKNSTMMSKLGNMEAAQSSEALTSIMNGFKLTAEETGEVVSKLVSIKFVETHCNMWIN